MNYNCPLCDQLSNLVLSDEQAFCTNLACNVITFNPSLADRGLSDIQEIKWDSKEPE